MDTAINELINHFVPTERKVTLEFLPQWFIQDDAITIFKKYMSELEAKRLWQEKGAELTKKINYKRHDTALTKPMSNPEQIQQIRFKAIYDMIIYNLRERDFEFNEEELLEKLKSVQDENKLFFLNILAARIKEFNMFYYILKQN